MQSLPAPMSGGLCADLGRRLDVFTRMSTRSSSCPQTATASEAVCAVNGERIQGSRRNSPCRSPRGGGEVGEGLSRAPPWEQTPPPPAHGGCGGGGLPSAPQAANRLLWVAFSLSRNNYKPSVPMFVSFQGKKWKVSPHPAPPGWRHRTGSCLLLLVVIFC